MNRSLLVFFLLWGLLFYRCSTELDLNAEFREIPVVYALLDLSDSMHYVRINRTFLEENTDAFILAEDPEQIYYGPELQVRIEEYNSGNRINTFTLERVDGDTLGLIKEEGVFAQSPNILYRFKRDLNAANTYKIIAESGELDVFVEAETNLVDDFLVTRPFFDPIFPTNINFAIFQDYQLRWNHAANADIYDIGMRFHYREADKDDINTILVDTFVDWNIAESEEYENASTGQGVVYNVDRNGFYNFIRFNFDPNPEVVRFADSVQFIFYAGNETLYQYILFNQAQLGITSFEITPDFTNVENGLGIMASRFYKITDKFNLSEDTRDSIACGSISGGLNFAPRLGHPNFPFCD